MRITVAFRDTVGAGFKVREIRRIETVMELDLERIARKCEEIIKATIMRKSKNPTGQLASFFYAYKIPEGWGIGDITELDTSVNYWNHCDKGSLGIGANWSHFLPKGFWENGVWVENSSGYAGIKPKTPVPAMNYISETIAQMDVLIPVLLKQGV